LWGGSVSRPGFRSSSTLPPGGATGGPALGENAGPPFLTSVRRVAPESIYHSSSKSRVDGGERVSKPLDQWTEDDLRGLIGQDEGLTVEFKRSDSLRFKTDSGKLKAELAKDVSAMANAAGGRIYYGIVEERGTGRAVSIDDGLTADEVTADQIGNLLTGNIEPAITGVRIGRINLANGNSAFAIDVPQATSMAPHQSRPDRVYYRRHDRKALPMYDHEIKDLMRRGDSPEIEVFLRHQQSAPDHFQIELMARNVSAVPVLYYSVDLILSDGMSNHGLNPSGVSVERKSFKVGGFDASGWAYSKSFVTPHALPLFKPRTHTLWVQTLQIQPGAKHPCAIVFTAPDFEGYWSGYFNRTGTRNVLMLEREPLTD